MWYSELKPAILHLGGSTELLTPSTVRDLKKQCGPLTVMRSIPVVGDESIAIAKSYDEIADMLLLDSHRPGDRQIGALGITHSWEINRKIVENVRIPRHHRWRPGARQRYRCHKSSAAGGRRFKNQDRQG